MKLKKLTTILILTIIICTHSKSFAKYVFEYTQRAIYLEIDRTAPKSQILKIINTNIGYETYANKAHEVIVEIKIFDNNKIINNFQDFIILVGTNEECCTKEIQILEEHENYIMYKIKLINILNDGKLYIKIPENSFEDIFENKMAEELIDTQIVIDNTVPIGIYGQENNEKGKITSIITTNEPIRQLDGWKSNNIGTVNSKEFISNISYGKQIIDLAGNIGNVEIDVKDATFLGLECIVHISEFGWIKQQENYIGPTVFSDQYKMEGLLIKTGTNFEKDFLNASAYMYTHWGIGSKSKSSEFEIIYNHGYNPKSGYKTLENSETVTYENKQYIHLGGEGANCKSATDINGNNPITAVVANQYNYGISGLRFTLKQQDEYSIIYQIFLNDTGWSQTYKNGEEAMEDENKTIGALKIAVIPNTELQEVIQDWNKNKGTYNKD